MNIKKDPGSKKKGNFAGAFPYLFFPSSDFLIARFREELCPPKKSNPPPD
jgi:hypothetical protein